MKRTFFILLSLITVLTVSAQQEFYNRQRVINVQASAETEITPDEIYVQIHLKEYDKKGSGKVDINTIKNDFLNRMKKLGLTEKEITVQSYSGSDGNYWYWHKKSKKDPELKASINYLVKLSSVKQIDEVVKNLDDEATQNFFIQKVTHSKIAARPRGAYALAGCTVAPGFEFVDFGFLEDDPVALARLTRVDARARDLV
jgi:hypothetical protein